MGDPEYIGSPLEVGKTDHGRCIHIIMGNISIHHLTDNSVSTYSHLALIRDTGQSRTLKSRVDGG